ncbi:MULTISPECIES: hypothetical protein [unclassified Streptomyces]|uniref:hypothetical protein n=1 Tax=unclassified Streptomyces TaxID=2593676 RepID=UPI002E819112|nr:hypothetical protein [Streptomyces sp. NBC_00562]WUC17488.1 hypothetical protein OHA33_00415 [Streptomyces sp. NBC_00562]WUC25179.1 hypothetical protein OHA33_44435 [Streptomyces sp. NBC_00562]
MQIIEVTGYAVRSAVITMGRTGTPLEFVIFPMLHVASPTFSSQVRIRLPHGERTASGAPQHNEFGALDH